VGGSTLFVRELYEDLLWARHPLWSMHRIRSHLFGAHSPANHDWGTLVVYESLPQDFDEQLRDFQYRQAKAAIDAAINDFDAALAEPLAKQAAPARSIEVCRERVTVAQGRLPLDGVYRAEGLGLLGSSFKRLAESEFRNRPRDRPAWAQSSESIDHLKEARRHYHDGARTFVLNAGQSPQKVASLHWLGVQTYSLDVILGEQKLDHELWHASMYVARQYLDSAVNNEERAWARGTLMELLLLRHGEAVGDEAAAALAEATTHLSHLVMLYPSARAFPNYSTRRQLRRYCDWWGSEDFLEALRRSTLIDEAGIGRIERIGKAAAELVDFMEAKGPVDEEKET
jgi:hypothetical protein